MLELLRIVAFVLLFIRFSYWIGSSLTIQEKKWKVVLLAQFCEAVLLFFITTQLLGRNVSFPMSSDWEVSGLGFVLVIIGVVGSFVAKRELGDAWIYAVASQVKPKQKLVTTGMYKIVRHPIYTSFVISYVGIELSLGSWLWVSALFLLIPFYFQTQKEEKELTAHFGEKYKEYQKATKMLIPWVF